MANRCSTELEVVPAIQNKFEVCALFKNREGLSLAIGAEKVY